MKLFKITSLALLTYIVSSCANPATYMNKVVEKTKIGMSENEFKNTFKNEMLISSKDNISVYKISKNGYDTYGAAPDFRFFYFVDQKLVQIDKGERAVDYRLKVD